MLADVRHNNPCFVKRRSLARSLVGGERGEVRHRVRGRGQGELRQLPRAAGARRRRVVPAYDNTLWGGTVAMPDHTPTTDDDREIREVIREFNAKITADQRVEVVQIPIADGITLCRRIG
ncbi:hypothetical protein EJB05_48507, partial [Eragrostis curvula]